MIQKITKLIIEFKHTWGEKILFDRENISNRQTTTHTRISHTVQYHKLSFLRRSTSYVKNK